MKVETVALGSVGAIALPLKTDGTVNVPVTDRAIRAKVDLSGRSTFRLTIGLRIRTGGLADGIRFADSATHLDVRFEPATFDVLATANPLGAVSTDLVATLPAPMRFVSVTFNTPPAVGSIDLHRMDGDVEAKEKTRSIGNNAQLSGDFTDMRFKMKSTPAPARNKLASLMMRGFPTGARVGIAPLPEPKANGQPITPDDVVPSFFHVTSEVITTSPANAEPLGGKLAEALRQHFASLPAPYPPEVILLLVLESDAPCNVDLTAFSIDYGLLRNSFRAVLLRSADFTDARAFTTRLREASTPLTSFLRSKLSNATRAALERIGSTVPDSILSGIAQDLNNAMQTQAFYDAQRFAGITLKPQTIAAAAGATGIARARVNRTLLEEAFPKEIAPIPAPSGSDKEVLRAQGANSSLDVKVDLPRALTVRAATLRLEGDLRADAPVPAAPNGGNGGGGGGGNTVPSWAIPIADTSGFSINAARAVAAKIEPAAPDDESAQALEATGLGIALSITTPEAELVAELREDQGGTPAGRILASTTVSVEQLDRPSFLLFAFRSPFVLSARVPYWIVLRATRGAALWLAQPGTGKIRIGDPTSKGWTDRGGFNDYDALYQLWSTTTAASGAAQANGGNSSGQDERMTVAIGSNVLTPAASDGKQRTVDITDALKLLVTGLPSNRPLIVAPLRVSALGKGNVTIYPPEVEYDLA